MCELITDLLSRHFRQSRLRKEAAQKKEQDTDVVAAEGLCTALMPQQDITPLSLHSCEELQSASGANSFLPC